MNFQEFIRSKGITQMQLADAMGCCRAHITKWTRGEVFPTPTSINNIVEGFAALGITVTYEDVFTAVLTTKREKERA